MKVEITRARTNAHPRKRKPPGHVIVGPLSSSAFVGSRAIPPLFTPLRLILGKQQAKAEERRHITRAYQKRLSDWKTLSPPIAFALSCSPMAISTCSPDSASGSRNATHRSQILGITARCFCRRRMARSSVVGQSAGLRRAINIHCSPDVSKTQSNYGSRENGP